MCAIGHYTLYGSGLYYNFIFLFLVWTIAFSSYGYVLNYCNNVNFLYEPIWRSMHLNRIAIRNLMEKLKFGPKSVSGFCSLAPQFLNWVRIWITWITLVDSRFSDWSRWYTVIELFKTGYHPIWFGCKNCTFNIALLGLQNQNRDEFYATTWIYAPPLDQVLFPLD